MPQGLQVYDSSGNLVIDTSTFVLKLITTFSVTATGSTALPSITGASFVADMEPAGSSTQAPDEVYISGSNVEYTLNGSRATQNIRVYAL